MKVEYTKTGRFYLALSNTAAAVIVSAVFMVLWLIGVTTYVIYPDILEHANTYVDVFKSDLILETMLFSWIRSAATLTVLWVVIGNIFDINHLKGLFMKTFKVEDGSIGW